MSQKKAEARKAKAPSPQPSAELTSERVEELLEEGHRLRRIVHERFERARMVGEDAMKFLVR